MAKVIDITEKLTFEPFPKLKIKDVEMEVCNDAETVLRLLQTVQESGELEAVLKCSELLFSEKDRKRLEKLRLTFRDYAEVVTEAMNLATGTDGDEPGENPSRTTT